MDVLIVHNDYGGLSGEEAVVESQAKLLQEHAHQVVFFRRGSAEIDHMSFGRMRAFVNGVYSVPAKKTMRDLIAKHKPDVVHIHNLFPLISPSVLTVCRETQVPVVMTVHNYRLVCPNGLHMPKGRYEICEKCRGGREYWCIIKNCERNGLKSLGYALRGYVSSHLGFFTRNVTLFACLTEFQRQRLIAEGYPRERLRVIPNMYPGGMEVEGDGNERGDFVAFVGRISPEKGIGLLLSATEKLRSIPFRLAGSYEAMPHLLRGAPANVSFLGRLEKAALSKLYEQSRLVVLCSTCFEGFPMAIVEAMAHAKPVIAPRIGGIPEIVDDGVTGLLFAPGDLNDLVEKVRYLWARPDLGRQMGQAGRLKALHEYSPETYYRRLMSTYEDAMASTPGMIGCRL
jgi:glycosyltransferase involved in cell wall biosynthesis